MSIFMKSWLLVLLLGCAITVVIANQAEFQQQQVLQSRIKADVDKRTLLIRKEVSGIRATLEDLASLYSIHRIENSEEFQRMVSPILQRNESFSAIGWYPVVANFERSDFERRENRSRETKFTISERDLAGNLVPAGSRTEYVSVLFIEPYQTNANAVGYDIASEPIRKKAVDFARATKGFSITAPINLVQDSIQQKSVLACFPVYRPNSIGKSAVVQNDECVGLMVGVVRVGTLIQDALSHLNNSAFELQVLDDTDSNMPIDFGVEGLTLAEGVNGRRMTSRIEWGGRQWTLAFSPTETYVHSIRSWPMWLSIATGLLLTLFCSSLVYVLSENSNRRTANRILKLDEEHLRLVLDSVADGWWDWDVNSDHVRYSDFWTEALGIGSGDLAGGNEALRSYCSEEDLENRNAQIVRCLKQHESGFCITYRISSGKGESRWLMERGRVVSWDKNGRATRLVGAVADVTAEKNAEDQAAEFEARIRESQKMESLGLLAGGIAHDFNNYLTCILGYTELAELFSGCSEKQNPALGRIRQATESAGQLTRQLLAYAGKGQNRVQIVDVGEVIAGSVRLLRSSLKKSVEITIEATDQPTARGDRSQIGQIAMNLIANAIDAVDEQGKVSVVSFVTSINPSEQSIGNLRTGKYSVLQVSDNGCGMKSDLVSKMFDPFFTTKDSGHGLGLAAVKGIVKQHAGFIDVKSTENFGTMLTVYLPFAGKLPIEESPIGLSDSKQVVGTILVIDDDKTVLDCVAQMLKLNGHQTFLANSGEEAIELFEQHSPEIDLLLVDMKMPGLCGLETFEQILEIDDQARGLLISGFTEESCAADFLSDNILGFLQKPIPINHLLREVELALDRPTPQNCSQE